MTKRSLTLLYTAIAQVIWKVSMFAQVLLHLNLDERLLYLHIATLHFYSTAFWKEIVHLVYLLYLRTAQLITK